ncbi:MAG: hypothetical protein Q7T03_04645 [Deltaproteobacteria bacterium]|nr:hypothetical protein [Deltaproteobacteria bacterium]
MDPITFSLIVMSLAFAASGCGHFNPLEEEDGEAKTDGGPRRRPDASHPIKDAGPADAGQSVDAGDDLGPEEEFPPREGIEERWSRFNRGLIDIDPDKNENRVNILLTNRLLSCPLGTGIAKTTCQDVLVFPLIPIPENSDPQAVTPLAHEDLGNGLSSVTFTVGAELYSGFFIIDRPGHDENHQIHRLDMPVRVNSDLVPFNPGNPLGSLVLGTKFLVAHQSGLASIFSWNGDGTVSPPTTNNLDFVITSTLGSTLFLKKDETSAWLLNTIPNPFPDPVTHEGVPAGFDYLELETTPDEKIKIDPAKKIRVGLATDAPLEPLQNLAVSPDGNSVILARGVEIMIASLQTGSVSPTLKLYDDAANGRKIVSAQWYHRGDIDKAFVTDSASNIYSVSIEDGEPVRSSSPLSLHGEPGPSYLDPSACILYQGLVLEDGAKSAVTAIRCDILD